MSSVFRCLAIVTFALFVLIMLSFNQPQFVQMDTVMSELLKGNEAIILFHYLAEPIVYIDSWFRFDYLF